MKDQWDFLRKHCLDQIPRMLGQLDRNVLSKHYGCFDRDYWHYKKSSFPSAIKQMGCFNLALVYNLQSELNPYYKKKSIKEMAIASLMYGVRLVKNDGSYDEWYYNERGWAGPSAYLLYAFAKTYQAFEHDLSELQQNEVKRSFQKTTRFLSQGAEGNYLANHTAKTICALSEVKKIIPVDNNIYEKVRSDYLKNYNEKEGWGKEYDGLDIGYETASISFLARYLRNEADLEIKKCVESSTRLVSHFCFPDYSFARSLGVRENSNFFPFGFAYFKEKYFTDFYYHSLIKSKMLYPGDQDDHYLFYRLYEVLEMLEVVGDENVSLVSFDYKDLLLKDAGVFSRNRNGIYSVLLYKNGGGLVVFKENKCLHLSLPLSIKFANNIYSTRMDRNVHLYEKENTIEFTARLSKVKRPYFNPVKRLIFDTLMIFSFSQKISHYLKMIIRWMLISTSRKSIGHISQKLIFKEHGLELMGEIYLSEKGVTFYNSTESSLVRFVPQSGYYLSCEGQEALEIENFKFHVDIK